MEYSSCHPLLQYSEEEMASNRKEYGMSNMEQLNTDIDSIVAWFNKQPHLVGAGIERHTIERMMLQAKGSIERTKERIEGLYSLRGTCPEFMANRDPHDYDLDSTWTWSCTVPMPKLYNGQRVTVMSSCVSEDTSLFDFVSLLRVGFMIGDVRLKHDYSIGDIYVLDLVNSSLSQLAKLNPYLMRKAESIFHEGYGARIVGIHVLNAPSFVDKILYVLKQIVKPKITDRIMIHSSLDDLHQYVPKEYLPREYGGTEKPLQELGEMWRSELRSADTRRYLLELERRVADESLRIGGKAVSDNDQLAGSFRKLELD